ncbi:30S ribosomal protein S9 [Candidatus Woesearchaeota archaeon]|nr:30S ribosomal protein S9 [Candidatus Woesearchaeota archaeon]
MNNTKVVHTSGKRKQAIARATLKKGSGVVRVNSKLLNVFEPNFAKIKIQEPLILAGDAASKIDIAVNTRGGGWSAQADAARLAIARGLVEFTGSKALKSAFLEYDRHLLIADVRRNEAHKPNDSKPRAARQKSYR